MNETFPCLDNELLTLIEEKNIFTGKTLEHKPRILLLYGSLRERSYSRLVIEGFAGKNIFFFYRR